MVTLSTTLIVQASDPVTRIPVLGQFRLQVSDAFGVVLELFELWTSVVDSRVSSAGDDGKRVVRAYVDGG